jgi:hypothetical protein
VSAHADDRIGVALAPLFVPRAEYGQRANKGLTMMISGLMLIGALAFFGLIGVFLVAALRDRSGANRVSDIEYASEYSDALRELRAITGRPITSDDGRLSDAAATASVRLAL